MAQRSGRDFPLAGEGADVYAHRAAATQRGTAPIAFLSLLLLSAVFGLGSVMLAGAPAEESSRCGCDAAQTVQVGDVDDGGDSLWCLARKLLGLPCDTAEEGSSA